MRKKFCTSRIGVLAAALTLVTTCLVGGTMAKYTTKAEGTGNGTIAKFDVDITAADEAVKGTLNNLFTTAREAGNGTNVVQDKLAPGTSGHFDLAVTNKSDVAVKVSNVTLAKATGSAEVPIKFAVTDNEAAEPTAASFKDIDNISSEITNKLNDTTISWDSTNDGNAKSVCIWWQWAEGITAADHTADTKLGTAAASGAAQTYGVNVSVTAEQVVASEVTAP